MRAFVGLGLLGVAVVMFWLWLEPATESARIAGMAAISPVPATGRPTGLPSPGGAVDATTPEAELVPELVSSRGESQQPAVSAQAIDYESVARADNWPPAVLEQVQAMYTESLLGNYDHAAHIGLDLLEDVEQYPQYRPMLHSAVGQSYESLGYTEMAIEQHLMALRIFPKHRPSYQAMRRLDAQFASDNPPLSPVVKAPGKAVPPIRLAPQGRN